MNLKMHVRSVLTQLRSGTLPIEIETGRYYGVPRNQRFCKQCNTGRIEDELHFVFECQKCANLRIHFESKLREYQIVSNSQTDLLKLISQSTKATIALSYYIINALKIRS